MSTQSYTNTPTATQLLQLDHVSDAFLRRIIEVVPDRVCRIPKVYFKGTSKEVDKRKIVKIMAAIKNNWCLARFNIYSVLSCDENGVIQIGLSYQDALGQKVFTDREVIFIETGTSKKIRAYLTYGADTYSTDSEVCFYNSPLLTTGVLEAVRLYRCTISELYQRVKLSKNILLAIEAEFAGKLEELFADLDARFAEGKVMYAPKNSTMSGVNFALADIDTAITTFINNVSIETGIPSWFFQEDVKNSQFILDHEEAELQRLFDKHVFSVLNFIFDVWGIEVDIEYPMYRSETHKIEVDLKKADIRYKNAAAERLEQMSRDMKIKRAYLAEDREIAKNNLAMEKPEDSSSSSGSVGGRML
jgi:hypothetical protein